MIDPVALAAFVPAALALNLTPGADMMLCVGQGLKHGPRAAWFASAGISTGSFVHVGIAGVGLSAILAQHRFAFDIIRWVGIAYLLWLAIQSLRRPSSKVTAAPAVKNNAFRTGLVVNLTNPKVILFVLAFIPQFVVPEAGPVLVQFFIYGAVIATGGFFINGVVGVWAGSLGQRLAHGSRLLDIVTAGIFSALAVRLALLERS